MFENLNWWEIGALLILALLIFGERLPNVISDGLRMLRNVRNMARNATTDLSRELGTDIQLEDLHPKSFIRKHLLSEEDEAALRRPLQGMYDDIKSDISGLKGDLSGVKDGIKDVADAANPRSLASPNGWMPSSPANGSAAETPSHAPRATPHPFDSDAT